MPQPTEPSAAHRLRSILGGSIGNLVEWYDWYAYSAFSLYFAKAFFPPADQSPAECGGRLLLMRPLVDG